LREDVPYYGIFAPIGTPKKIIDVFEETVAFIEADRLTHANLQINPHAVFLFKEGGRPGSRCNHQPCRSFHF
jgi:hypothetical protein